MITFSHNCCKCKLDNDVKHLAYWKRHTTCLINVRCRTTKLSTIYKSFYPDKVRREHHVMKFHFPWRGERWYREAQRRSQWEQSHFYCTVWLWRLLQMYGFICILISCVYNHAYVNTDTHTHIWTHMHPPPPPPPLTFKKSITWQECFHLVRFLLLPSVLLYLFTVIIPTSLQYP